MTLDTYERLFEDRIDEVDTKHATSSLRDGQLVRVDGTTGTVTLLADAGSPAAAGDEVAVG